MVTSATTCFTVGYHLYKAYPKLGITSRAELAALFRSHTPVIA
jgi:DNA-binding CsgD family transcriptional regulator